MLPVVIQRHLSNGFPDFHLDVYRSQYRQEVEIDAVAFVIPAGGDNIQESGTCSSSKEAKLLSILSCIAVCVESCF